MKYKNKNCGFTLVELLIVISIISLLASIVLASLNNARVNARDTQRISDIRQMRIALELYRNVNGGYPALGGWKQSNDSNWSELQTELAPYMPKLPIDPVNNDWGGPGPWINLKYNYSYFYNTTFKSYELVAQLENPQNPLRCEVKSWYSYMWNGSWCPTHGSGTPYIYTGDY
jgi:prepilin-type N-terminal cleavage/methylation domain-containing protein